MIETINDVAVELIKLYRENLVKKENFKRGEKSKIFLDIFKILFERYGKHLGYSSISDFKSDVMQVKNNLKSGNKISNTSSPSFSSHSNFSFFEPNEGSGEIFTDWQIENLNLNPDSYK